MLTFNKLFRSVQVLLSWIRPLQSEELFREIIN